jgi:hypothetical protein
MCLNTKRGRKKERTNTFRSSSAKNRWPFVGATKTAEARSALPAPQNALSEADHPELAYASRALRAWRGGICLLDKAKSMKGSIYLVG